MPVQIMLRGLILVSVYDNAKSPGDRTITASLIDGSRSLDQAVMTSINRYKGKKQPHPDFDNCMRMNQGHHKHRGEIQVFDGTNNDVAGPRALPPGENLNILIDKKNQNYVKTAASYDRYMPNLREIAANAGLTEPAKFDPHDPLKSFNHEFISHTVTINRGVARVREVGNWDAGAITIPAKYRKRRDLNGPDPADAVYRPEALYQPAKVRFLNANVLGYVATECVIDVEDTNSVTIASSTHGRHTYKGNPQPSLRAAEDTVEILITNYAPQQPIALPWTLHYRWMFEAAGYNAGIPLHGAELDRLKAFGGHYDRESWVCESEMFLDGPNQSGYPFPYRTPDLWSAPLGQLEYDQPYAYEPPTPPSSKPSSKKPDLAHTDPGDPVACPTGSISPGR